MAFNFEVFKTRALTAIIFVLIMLGGILWNEWSFLALFSIIHFGCWIEYQKIIGLIYPNYQLISKFHRNCIMLLGFMLILLFTDGFYQVGRIQLHAIGWYGLQLCTIVFCLNEIILKKQLDLKTIGFSILGIGYISFSWSCLIQLSQYGIYNKFLFTHHWQLPLILICSIWINDTMAYLVGSFIGKTPLSAISPKKTWEGTIGGAVLAIGLVSVGCRYIFHIENIYMLITVSATAAIVGTLGDLLESKLKRLAGVKDSGEIMPGHGGFLDRFDSLLLATPIVWLLLTFLF